MRMNSEDAFAKLALNPSDVLEESIRILVKIADNIVKDPTNLKVRSLNKRNSTIQNKVLAANGALDCLKLMGFQETETSFVLPPNSATDKVEQVRNSLICLISNNEQAEVAPEGKVEMVTNNVSNDDDLEKVKRFILPPLELKSSNPFLRNIEVQFHNALAFGDKDCQRRAKKLIPLSRLERNAQKNLRYMQMRIKKEQIVDPEFSIQDMQLLELLTWFKDEFFTWVDSPNCDSCSGKTVMSHMSTDPEDLVYTNRVEVHKCEHCNNSVKFPRFNDLNILLETRKGRCGEWAQVFTLLCMSLGWDARYVIDELDHVWTEVYSVTQKRWVHCDPCENACDTPLMYESGWNKKLTYIIAYSPDEVQDVTWRYSNNHKEVLSRRKKCTEADLINTLILLRNGRHRTFTKSKQNYLIRRLINELLELMTERKPHENEKQGRTSGSKEWRVARGEIKNTNVYVWRISDKHIINNVLTIQYSAAADTYEFVKGDGKVIKVSDWSSGVFDYTNVFRKEENDWKIVYLARSEGSDEGSITWKIELENDSKRAIDKISLKFSNHIFENGEVDVKLSSDDVCLDFPKNETCLETHAFSGMKYLLIKVVLSAGKGNVAWQHAQLFRQSLDSREYPFVLAVIFKT